MSSRTAEGGYLGPLPPGLAAADIQRRRRLLQKWKRRSLLVHTLRRLLPTLCVLIVIGLVGWAAINTLFWRTSFSPAGGGLEIRMVRPNFQGRNEAGKPFLLSASSAVRDSNDAARVTLEDPVFTLGSAPGDKTTVHAKHGVYREDSRILDLKGTVTLDDAQGYHFVTEHALVSTLKSDVDGEGHIEGHGPLGRIAASSYAVRSGGAHIFFTGQVKARIEHHAAPAASPAAPAKKD
jgi:lipopolysaccharide export system protein LptC